MKTQKYKELIGSTMVRLYEAVFGNMLYGGVLSGSVWHGIGFLWRPTDNKYEQFLDRHDQI